MRFVFSRAASVGGPIHWRRRRVVLPRWIF